MNSLSRNTVLAFTAVAFVAIVLLFLAWAYIGPILLSDQTTDDRADSISTSASPVPIPDPSVTPPE